MCSSGIPPRACPSSRRRGSRAGSTRCVPVAGWKAQASDYERLVALVGRALPNAGTLATIEKAFVDDVVRGQDRLVS